MKYLLNLLFISLIFSGCVGTDFVDDPIVGKKIVVSTESVALKINDSEKVSALYFNEYGIAENASITWTSTSPSIISIQADGTLNALNAGQSSIVASFSGVSDTIRVTVVADENAVARVEITSSKTVFSIGDSEKLVVNVFNINNQLIPNKTIAFRSSNISVFSIDSVGNAKAISNGSSVLTAEVEGVASNEILFTVGASRMGNFVKIGGYEASGSTILKIENGNLTLELTPNFKTSFALGTYIYLSNTIANGSVVRSSGIEISQISASGFHSFNVNSKYPNVKINDYKYVVVLCKPASLIFGYAELN